MNEWKNMNEWMKEYEWINERIWIMNECINELVWDEKLSSWNEWMTKVHEKKNKWMNECINCSVADPFHFDMDPDPAQNPT